MHAVLPTYTVGKVTREVAWRERIRAEAFPRSRELLGVLLNADRDTEFHAGLDAILAGFAAEICGRPGQSGDSYRRRRSVRI